jgi:hypothetical protein
MKLKISVKICVYLWACILLKFVVPGSGYTLQPGYVYSVSASEVEKFVAPYGDFAEGVAVVKGVAPFGGFPTQAFYFAVNGVSLGAGQAAQAARNGGVPAYIAFALPRFAGRACVGGRGLRCAEGRAPFQTFKDSCGDVVFGR